MVARRNPPVTLFHKATQISGTEPNSLSSPNHRKPMPAIHHKRSSLTEKKTKAFT